MTKKFYLETLKKCAGSLSFPLLTYDFGQSIWRLFHVLAQFLFNASEIKLDHYQQKVSVRVASRVAK